MGTSFFGVIGNRDYIKYHGERRPFWEFLDTQPSGWLTSLVYMREDLPQDKIMIWDCGAWSYRDEPIPKMGKHLVTAEWAFEQYVARARLGDMPIAPDHMLISRYDNLDECREFNRTSARRFLELTRDSEFVPVATAHGITEEEQIEHARWLHDIGYHAIALGGMAGRAAAKRRNVEVVSQVREALPEVWLHILGLSSPDYAAHWYRLGVDSFDGSAHFKQAFTAGAFFTIEMGQMVKYKAASTERGNPNNLLENITAPLCHCRACFLLREEGIDTRTYGSNEHNMGRAAHNLNMLMQAQQIAVHGTTVLVSCVGQKADEPLPAAVLYQSPWFRKARRYAEVRGDTWYILSAQHGLIDPQTIVAPYEMTLNNMGVGERGDWGQKTSEQIRDTIPAGAHIVLLAGKRYREQLDLARYTVTIPMKGLGIGQQLAWLDAALSREYTQESLF